MQLAALAWLSESQNRIFDRRLANASQELGLEITPAPGPEEAELVYLCGLPASRMLDTHFPLLAPVLPGDRYQEQPWYFVDVLSRTEETGLGQGRWAYNQTTSFSGWLAVRHGLRLHHVDPDQLEWVETGSHANSLSALRNGTADLAGVDSMIVDLDSQLAKDLTVVDSWGPWPTPPVMASRTLEQGLVDELASAFMGSDEAIKWVALDLGHLEPIQVLAGSTATGREADSAGGAVPR